LKHLAKPFKEQRTFTPSSGVDLCSDCLFYNILFAFQGGMMIFMTIPSKKLANGFELPVYGLGLWEMGGRGTADYSQDEREVAAIRAALERGVTHFDAAEKYGAGHAEELLGRAAEGFARDGLVIATKVAGVNMSYDGVRLAAERSLQRLKMDYLDLYILHEMPAPGLTLAEAVRALDELVDEGVVRQIGVSNFSPAQFESAQKLSRHKLVCNQVHYNLAFREVELGGVLKQCQDADAFVVAYRPLKKAGFAGAAVVAELAKKYGRTPAQVAINWLVSQDHVVTICKTSDVAHLEENLGALDWTMEPGDVERLRQEYPDQQSVSDVAPLG
jgi:diketogulonate reductase-like aldo/keto reductase